MDSKTKSALIGSGVAVAAGLLGTLLLPGIGTAVGAEAGAAAGAGAATAAGAGGAAATGTTATAAGATGATATNAANAAITAAGKSAGAVGSHIATGAADTARYGAKVAQTGERLINGGKATKLGNAMVNSGDWTAKAGQKVAEGMGKFADGQRKYLGDYGTKALKYGEDTAINYGEQELNNAMDKPDTNTRKNTPIETKQYENTISDENLKDVQGNVDPIEAFSNIDAYLYKYKPEAQAMYGDEGKVNNEENFGVMAQELAENPLTAAAVNEDENGYLEVDGSRLSTMNTAVIGELCKRIMALEAQVYGGK